MTMDRKYTDKDVRDDFARMSTLAYAYLDQYAGNFSFLVDCREYYKEYNYLGHTHIRGVLNSMLADPNVVNMPVPVRKKFNAHDPVLPTVGEAALNLGPAPAPQRPILLPLPTRWRLTHGVSNHKRSFVVHQVDTERSCGVLCRKDDTIRWAFHWRCNYYSPPQPFEKTIALFSLDDAVLMVKTGNAGHVSTLTVGEKVRPWKWCRGCDNAGA